ncbi:helix-turn-helix transcriptional regulator [Brevibacterium casei]|nr:helix-turn-helix transcriptional regulator [Brevibacterium casei]
MELAEEDEALLDELVAIRKRNKLTQAQVADAIGRDQSAISQFEAPRRRPSTVDHSPLRSRGRCLSVPSRRQFRGGDTRAYLPVGCGLLAWRRERIKRQERPRGTR